MKVVVDSSGWIEFFAGLPKADKFAKYLLGSHSLFIPAVVIYEVYRKTKKELGEEEAIMCMGQMQKGTIVPFDSDMALYAADLSLQHGLPMADSQVYAAALFHQAQLVTSDNDFRGLPGVVLI
ncbi:MAG: type II toxin-antitoxin system VapC family toxin [Deltaproteobacteria bacterium]|nr:type II toxin-antitoxin system VapC family toxin [Deltaproteobacteria bacterium]